MGLSLGLSSSQMAETAKRDFTLDLQAEDELRMQRRKRLQEINAAETARGMQREAEEAYNLQLQEAESGEAEAGAQAEEAEIERIYNLKLQEGRLRHRTGVTEQCAKRSMRGWTVEELEKQRAATVHRDKHRKQKEELDRAEYIAGTSIYPGDMTKVKQTKPPSVETERPSYLVMAMETGYNHEAGSESDVVDGPGVLQGGRHSALSLFAGHSQIVPTQMAAGGTAHMTVSDWSMKVRERVNHFNRTSETHGHLLRKLGYAQPWNPSDRMKQRSMESDAPLNLMKVAENTRGKCTSVLRYLLGIKYREEFSRASELTQILEGENIAIYSCDLRKEYLENR